MEKLVQRMAGCSAASREAGAQVENWRAWRGLNGDDDNDWRAASARSHLLGTF